jgi:large subunit ribosomal protein L25
MAGQSVTLNVSQRELLGSAESRRLRRRGFVPGVLYGMGDPQAFFIGDRELRRALTGDHGFHAIFDVVLEGQAGAPRHAVLKDFQLDPIRSTLVHVDLHEVRLDQTIQTQVSVEAVGTPAGETHGGMLQLLIHQLNVEALPMSVPDRIEIDVTLLGIGDSAKISDIVPIAGVTLLDDPETVIVSVVATRAEMAAAAEGEEGEAGEDGAPTEAEPGDEAESE